MAIPLPNLDDRSYAELTAEAQALIPSVYPGWTNHNPSDPGVVLIELLAWLTEMLMFQVNEIPEANTEKFLKLLNAPKWTRPTGMSLEEATRQTMRQVRERYRAITPDDYEHLALHDWAQSEEAAQLVQDTGQPQAAHLRRAKCVPRRNLEEPNLALRNEPAPAHISLVVLPEPTANQSYPAPSEALRAAMAGFSRPAER
ncbi:MAG: hypothetical protein HC853_06185 [Anaerolineae bacterium]|nr:hypothetical protein [Anaerolineae bacterium]